jgi:L-fuconolactonase
MLFFIGVRHLVNAEPDPDWILHPDTLRGLQILAARSLPLDCVGILARHLEHGPVFARRVPICAY